MNEKYEQKKAILGPAQPITFKDTMISLTIPDDGLNLDDQWRVYPAFPPKVYCTYKRKKRSDYQRVHVRRSPGERLMTTRPGMCAPLCLTVSWSQDG